MAGCNQVVFPASGVLNDLVQKQIFGSDLRNIGRLALGCEIKKPDWVVTYESREL